MFDLRRVLQVVSVVVLLAASPWILGGLFITIGTTCGAIDEHLYRDRTSFSAERWRTGNGKVRFDQTEAAGGATVSFEGTYHGDKLAGKWKGGGVGGMFMLKLKEE